MSELRAVRNLRLCSKDCLCLFVCPTGATDTETGQIDFEKCNGCGACFKACPSGAISMVPYKYPHEQKKDDEVINKIKKIISSKVTQEQIANYIYENTNNQNDKLRAEILIKSNRIITEDLYREAGFMIPQSSNTKKFLQELLEKDKMNKETISKLLELLEFNK